MRWLTVLCLLTGSAAAMPGRQIDVAYCSTHTDTKDPDWRHYCVTRAWCTDHWNEDRITRITCDPMRTRADLKQRRLSISPAALEASRDLTEAERDDGLLPPNMKAAKLGLRASISVWTFPATVVRLGIASADTGTIWMSWNDNGTGPRVTSSVPLNAREIADLLTALNASDFWRLPHEPRHMGPADGEIATVAVGIRGRQNQVMDDIGDSEAVDLSTLVNAVSTIIRHHWKNVPGG